MRNTRQALGLALTLGFSLLLATTGCDSFRTFFPSSHHDEEAPELPSDLGSPAVLVFSKTNGFRHSEAIEAGLPAFEAIARERGMDLFATENGAVHSPELLSRFDAIVWFNVSGDVLSGDQRAALLEAIRSGTGFLGIHGTGGDPSYAWPEHSGTLVRAQFVGHPMGPQFQEATIRVEATDHPVMAGIDPSWSRVEEWYSFAESPRGPDVEVLATVDETTYSPRMKIFVIDRDLRMGDDHPIVWSHCIGRGRAVYSALGHQTAAYHEPLHLRFLAQAIDWVRSTPAEGCRLPRGETERLRDQPRGG